MNASRLIHALILERAERIAWEREARAWMPKSGRLTCVVAGEFERDAARAQVERFLLADPPLDVPPLSAMVRTTKGTT